MQTQVIPSRLIIRPNGEQAPIPTTVVNKEGGRLLRRLQAVHDLHPEVDHLDGGAARAQVADVLVQGHEVVGSSGGLLLEGLGLDMVADPL